MLEALSDILGVEVRHALARRFLVNASVQKKVPSFERLMTDWGTREATSIDFERDEFGAEPARRKIEKKMKQRRKKAPPKVERKRKRRSETNKFGKRGGGGGMWRAFVHFRTLGRPRLTKQQWGELSREYAALDAEQIEHFREYGGIATLRHRYGSCGFDKKPKRGHI